MSKKQHRIFVEWHDHDRPEWGGYVSSLSPEFQQSLIEFTEKYGPPTKVEFRADGRGWEDSKSKQIMQLGRGGSIPPQNPFTNQQVFNLLKRKQQLLNLTTTTPKEQDHDQS